MALSINSNTGFELVHQMQLTTADFVQALQRLSSGLRINSAADDPSGLAISEGLLSQANGLDQVQTNMQSGVSMLQAAQAGLSQIQTALSRLSQLAIQGATGSLSLSDRQNIQSEANSLLSEIDQVSRQTQFGSRKLLDGSAGGAVVGGGGPDIAGIVGQAGVAFAGSFSVSAPGAQQAIESINGNLPSTFTANSSITIQLGATSKTFSVSAGSKVTDFVNVVNADTTLQGKVRAGMTSDGHLVIYAVNNGADTTSGHTSLLSVFGATADFAGSNYRFSTSGSAAAGATTTQLAAFAQGSTINNNPDSFATTSATGGPGTFSAIEAQTQGGLAYNTVLTAGSSLEVKAGNGVTYTFDVTATQIDVTSSDASFTGTITSNLNGGAPTVNTFIDAVNAITVGGPGGTHPLNGAALDGGGAVIAGGAMTAVQNVIINNTTAGVQDSAHPSAPVAVSASSASGSFSQASGTAVIFDLAPDANNSALAAAGDLLNGRVLSATNPTNFLAVDPENQLQSTASKSALLSGNVPGGGGSFVSPSSSITIIGGLGTQTFTVASGTTLSDFFTTVNNSGIGVTIGTDSASGKVLIQNTNFGGINELTGLQAADAPAQVNIAAPTGDFAVSGLPGALDMNFTAGNNSTAGVAFTPAANQGSVDATGTYTQGAAGVDSALMLKGPGGSAINLTASGNDSQVVNGAGALAGLQITLSNPGSFSGGDVFFVEQTPQLNFQTGINQSDTAPFAIDAQGTLALGLSGFNLMTQASSQSAITAVQTAIDQVSTTQATLGALQNSLTDTQNAAAAQEQSVLQARSNIVDANIPQEVVRFIHDQILLQADAALLVQANQGPSELVNLLTNLAATQHP